MRRREAIEILREICKCIPDAFVSSVSLSPSAYLENEFELKISVALERKYLRNVEALVQRCGLMLKESKGQLLIYGSKRATSEVLIAA